MIPDTPAAREWRPLIRRLTAGLALALLVIGTLAVILIRTQEALDQSKAATRQSKHAIDCTNTVLAKRASTTAADNKAHVQFHTAFTADAKAFGLLLTDILTNAPASKSTPDFLAYIKVHDTLIRVSSSTAATLQADQDYRDAHPIGLC